MPTAKHHALPKEDPAADGRLPSIMQCPKRTQQLMAARSRDCEHLNVSNNRSASYVAAADAEEACLDVVGDAGCQVAACVSRALRLYQRIGEPAAALACKRQNTCRHALLFRHDCFWAMKPGAAAVSQDRKTGRQSRLPDHTIGQ